MVVDQDDRGSRFMEGFFQNAADIHGGLGRRPFGDVFLAKTLVLAVQEHGYHNLLTLAGETWTEMVGNGQRGFKGGCCEFPGANTFSEFNCRLDLSDLCRPKARHLQQVMSAGAVEAAKTSEILQDRKGSLEGVFPWDTFPECP